MHYSTTDHIERSSTLLRLSRAPAVLLKKVNLRCSEKGSGTHHIVHIDDGSCMALAVLACCPGGGTREGKEGLDHRGSLDIIVPIPELVRNVQTKRVSWQPEERIIS
jgi:hypothetical protein